MEPNSNRNLIVMASNLLAMASNLEAQIMSFEFPCVISAPPFLPQPHPKPHLARTQYGSPCILEAIGGTLDEFQNAKTITSGFISS